MCICTFYLMFLNTFALVVALGTSWRQEGPQSAPRQLWTLKVDVSRILYHFGIEFERVYEDVLTSYEYT